MATRAKDQKSRTTKELASDRTNDRNETAGALELTHHFDRSKSSSPVLGGGVERRGKQNYFQAPRDVRELAESLFWGVGQESGPEDQNVGEWSAAGVECLGQLGRDFEHCHAWLGLQTPPNSLTEEGVFECDDDSDLATAFGCQQASPRLNMELAAFASKNVVSPDRVEWEIPKVVDYVGL